MHEFINRTMDSRFGPGKSPAREFMRLFRVAYSSETFSVPAFAAVQGWGTCHYLACPL